MELSLDLQARIAGICACLSAHGINAVCAIYHGYGDEGQIESVCVADGEEERDLDAIPLPEAEDPRSITHRGDGREHSLADAISDITDAVIDACGHSGYHNNEGGNGTLTLFADGTWTLDHHDAYVAYEDADYQGRVTPLPVAGVETLSLV